MDADRFAAELRTLIARLSRRAALRLLSGLGLAGLISPTDAKKKHKHKKKKCAKVGQRTWKRRKKCCKGLVKDGSGRCAQPASPPCVPRACPATGCGDLPDGCGGTLRCGCPANQICLRRGACRSCTVTCTGTPAQCGVTLQTAISRGGTVYVCPGTYQGGFTLFDDAVTVIGAGDGTDAARNTILDGNAAGRVLTINAEVGTVVLERLRITGGNSATASGIRHGGTSLRMTECTVSGNTSVDSAGGGILVGTGSTLVMTRCTVRDNHATSQTGVGTGGGIHAAGTTTLTDCLIEANEAANSGGGLYVVGETTLLGTTQVRANEAGLGGGIAVAAGTSAAGTLVIAETCRVTQNTAGEGFGGGIRRFGGTVTLQGATPSPIVVDNCHENCVGTVPKCATVPVSC